MTANASSRQPPRRKSGGKGTEAAVPGVELSDSRGQIRGLKVRPHARHEIELGVSAFPEQKIAQPILSAGPDQQVHIRRDVRAAGGCQSFLKCVDARFAL